MDGPGARGFLTDVVARLSNAATAQQTHEYLSSKNVKGSLMRSVLPVLNQAESWRVVRPSWTAHVQPGVLVLRGTVMLTPVHAGPDTAALPFEVQAEFRGTREGTVLAVLEMRAAP